MVVMSLSNREGTQKHMILLDLTPTVLVSMERVGNVMIGTHTTIESSDVAVVEDRMEAYAVAWRAAEGQCAVVRRHATTDVS